MLISILGVRAWISEGIEFRKISMKPFSFLYNQVLTEEPDANEIGIISSS